MTATPTVVLGDITTQAVDAIVNAANAALCGGGGVDGAIHRAAGPELLAECRTLGRCAPGGARITKGYRLPARYVIHAVGPVWQDGNAGEDTLLASCYRQAMELADAHGCASIAFPAISCGAYRFPIDRAARIATRTVHASLSTCRSVTAVLFVVFDQSLKAAYEKEVARVLHMAQPD